MTTNVDGNGRLPVMLGVPIAWAGASTTFHSVSTPTRYLTSWSMLSDLRERVEGFDVVHIHALYRFHTIAAAAVARRRGVPYVIQPHGSLDPWHRRRRQHAKDVWHALVEDRIIDRASAILCTSDSEARAVQGLGYTVPTWVVPVGINAGELRMPVAVDALPSAARGRGGSVVTFLGRIAPKKGVPLLVEAFKATAASFPTAHLVIAGPDDEGIGRGLSAFIADSGLGDRISFVGTVTGSAKRALLQRSNVFVLPSADESFGVAVAEAMAVGCPVVVSPEVAIEDVVRTSGAGVVAERDPAALAEAIATILADQARAMRMGEAGRLAVDSHFAWPIVAEQTESLYEAIAGATPSACRTRPRGAGAGRQGA